MFKFLMAACTLIVGFAFLMLAGLGFFYQVDNPESLAGYAICGLSLLLCTSWLVRSSMSDLDKRLDKTFRGVLGE